MVRVACKLLLLLYRRLRSSSLKDEIDSGALLVTQCPAKDDPTRFHNIASAIFCFILFLICYSLRVTKRVRKNNANFFERTPVHNKYIHTELKKLQSKDETFLEAFTQCDFGGQSWKHLKGFGYQYLMSGQIGLHYPNTTAM